MKMSTALRGNPSASRPEKAAAQAERRKVLTRHTLSVLEKNGYRFGRSLRLPGAFAFEAERSGVVTRVGIKNAADRWVAIPQEGWGMIGEVDEVAVSAFDSWENPTIVEVWLFRASELLTKVEAAQEALKVHGIRGLPFIPISGGGERRPELVRATGTLDAIGRCIDREIIEWGDPASITSPPTALAAVEAVEDAEISEAAADEPDSESPLTIPEAKRRLAKTLGVRPENVKITVEA